jgi:hypothetical protein
MLEDLRARQHTASARAAATMPGAAIRGAEDDTIPVPPVAPGARRAAASEGVPSSRQRRWFVGLVVVALVAVIAGGAHFGRRYLASRAARSTAAVPGENDEDGQAVPRGRPLTYSVAIESFDRLERATSRVDSLTLAIPGQTFSIAPFALDDIMYYRVLAGPLPDSASAAALMQTLVARGEKSAAVEGDVRETPLAFLLGVFADRIQAQTRMNQLRETGVPGYIVTVPYTEGAPRYHLYGGAYSVPSEAEAMRALLRNAGVADTLVVRVGQAGS